METKMNTQPKANIDILIEAHPDKWVKTASQNKMRWRAHAKTETQSLDNTGKISHPTMPFEAKIEKAAIESEWENLLEY